MNLFSTFASLRKTVAGLGMVTLIAGMFATGVATAVTSHTFTDVPADAWFAQYVNGLADAGAIDSTGDMYRPGDLVNRAEMSKFAFTVSGLPLEHAAAAPFKDVAMGQWYTDYIYTLSKNGIVSGDKKDGVPTGYFRPSDALNRAEATKMLVNAAQMAEDLSGAPHFPDVKSADWFYNFVETAFNNGVVAGYPDGTFGPAKNINRAEVSKMVYLSMNPVSAGFTLDSAAAASTTTVELIYSMNAEKASSETVANYTIEDSSGTPLVVSAAKQTAPDTVLLTAATQTKGKVYYVTAKNVKSEAGEALSNTDSVSFLGYGADVSGGDLKVSLSTETPVAGSIPMGATGVVFTCWDFTGGATASMVKSLNVHRVGPGAESAFDNVYLYNGDTRVTTGRSINNASQSVEFSNVNQNVAAGQNVKICLVGDIANADVSGGVHAFELANAAAVSSNSSSMTGSFPLRGADQLITSAVVGSATVTKNGSLDEVTVGSTGARVAQFQIATATEDQQLNRIALYVRGSVPVTALQNLKLYVEGNATALASVDSVGAKDLATFVLSTPYKISKGQTKIFYVTADINGARNGDDIKIYLDQATDLYITGLTYGYGTQVDIGATSGTYDGNGTNYSYVLLKGSKFTIAFNGPVAGNLAVNQKQAKCMAMTLTNAAGLDVTIKDWYVNLTAGNNPGATLDDGLLVGDGAAGAVANYTNIQLVSLNDDGTVGGVLLGSNELIATATASDTTQNVKLTGASTIASGESVKAAVIFDVANNPDATFANDTIKCTLNAPTDNDQIKDSNNDSLGDTNITPSSNISGNTMTIAAAALAFTKNSSPANNTKYAKGTANATMLAFQAKAGSALDTTIKTLTVDGNNLTGATDIKDLVDSLGIYKADGTLVSTLKSFPASAVGVNSAVITFNNLSIPVAKNSTVNLYLKGMVSNSIGAASTVTFNLDSSTLPLVVDSAGQTVTGVDVSGVDSAVGAPNSTSLQSILGSSPTVASTSPAANDPKMYAEAQTNPIYAFTLKSTDGDSTLQDMTVNLSTSGALLPVDSVALYSATSSGACGTATLLKDYESVITNTAPTTTGRVNFTNINKTLTDSQNVYLCVMVKSKNVVSATPVSNTNIVMGSIYFDKVQDTSGTTLTVDPIIINTGAIATASTFTSLAGEEASSVTVASTGFGYDAVPAVLLGGNCTIGTATAAATLTDGRVTAITLTPGTLACNATQTVTYTVAAAPAADVTLSPNVFFKGVPTFESVALPSKVMTAGTNDVLKFKAGAIGSVSSLNQLVVTLEESVVASSCTLYRGNTPVSNSTSVDAAADVAGEDQVVFDTFTPTLVPESTPWNDGLIYTVKCSYAAVATGDSVKAKLATILGGGTKTSAIVWDDSNGAVLSDAAFITVDDILFSNNVEATDKLSAL